MASAKGGRPRGGIPDPAVIEREQEVVKLRRGGLTWLDIAKRLDFADPSGPQRAYQRAQARVVADDITAMRQIENDRLDTLQAAHWGKALAGDIGSSNIVLRTIVERAKLNGLNAPIQIEQKVIQYDANDIRAELARIVANAQPASSRPALQVAEPTSQTEPTTT